MNVFEMNFIAAPIAGIVSGIHAGSGHRIEIGIASAVVGTVFGVVAAAMPVIAASALFKDDPSRPADRPTPLNWSIGMFICLLAMIGPFVAWFGTAFCVSYALRSMV